MNCITAVVDRVRGKLDCRPYRGRGEGNPKRLVEGASRAFSNRSNILTIRNEASVVPRKDPDCEAKKILHDRAVLPGGHCCRQRVLTFIKP